MHIGLEYMSRMEVMTSFLPPSCRCQHIARGARILGEAVRQLMRNTRGYTHKGQADDGDDDDFAVAVAETRTS